VFSDPSFCGYCGEQFCHRALAKCDTSYWNALGRRFQVSQAKPLAYLDWDTPSLSAKPLNTPVGVTTG
jgi:hypothetical protein